MKLSSDKKRYARWNGAAVIANHPAKWTFEWITMDGGSSKERATRRLVCWLAFEQRNQIGNGGFRVAAMNFTENFDYIRILFIAMLKVAGAVFALPSLCPIVLRWVDGVLNICTVCSVHTYHTPLLVVFLIMCDDNNGSNFNFVPTESIFPWPTFNIGWTTIFFSLWSSSKLSKSF